VREEEEERETLPLLLRVVVPGLVLRLMPVLTPRLETFGRVALPTELPTRPEVRLLLPDERETLPAEREVVEPRLTLAPLLRDEALGRLTALEPVREAADERLTLLDERETEDDDF